MIRTLCNVSGRIDVAAGEAARDAADAAIWIDLSDPTPGEVERIEGLFGAAIPSHEDMVEIEKSSRLYAVRDVAMMTVPLLIKIFLVVAVAFLPPTLIASTDGLNFKRMPELDWWFGYSLAIAVMIASMVLPYVFFRRKGWI